MKKAVHSIKVNYEKGIEKNNELKLNIDEQQDYIGDLKKKLSDIYYEEEV